MNTPTISINGNTAQAVAPSTNKVIRNTYTLLSMTLLFSAAMAAVSVWLRLPPMVTLLSTGGALLLIWASLALTAIDIDTQLLPDDITLPLLWTGLLFNYFGVFTSLHNALLGAVIGYLVLWTVYWLFKLVTGKEGMGYGDFKLLAALGAWLGWQMLPLIILLSSLVGAMVGIILIVALKHGRNIPIPFGPYLAGGGLIALFWGPALTQIYLRLLS